VSEPILRVKLSQMKQQTLVFEALLFNQELRLSVIAYDHSQAQRLLYNDLVLSGGSDVTAGLCVQPALEVGHAGEHGGLGGEATGSDV
jgi:hypothetical protein